MDEAFSALDPLKRIEMQGLMLELQREQKRTILFVSHDLSEALRIGSRIAIMEGGTLVQVGTAREIITRPVNDYVRKFFEGVDTAQYLTAADLMDPELNGHSYHGGPKVSSTAMLPDVMKLVLGLREPVGVVDEATDQLMGCMTPKSLLVKISQQARHV
jgi:glycine betaine/proline transport system ATP-binding protein